ncbi:Hemoglobin subunit alpha-A [Dissostichus eleginoides]|uniref:Hemoglobin subunit alpha-A n=1 Tax=Dissostichus eleginoides TaxID=100907 RepID=A0AAD9CSJ3_DISEL|nr:Hemoglobin subunit alpha-A [Dissostichus eleginoides]
MTYLSYLTEQTEQSASHIGVCISVSWNTDEDVSGAGKELCDFRLMRLSIDPVRAGVCESVEEREGNTDNCVFSVNVEGLATFQRLKEVSEPQAFQQPLQ